MLILIILSSSSSRTTGNIKKRGEKECGKKERVKVQDGRREFVIELKAWRLRAFSDLMSRTKSK